jgi:NADH-quinone oxidoreductase subunit I
MGITMLNFVRPKVTEQYPENRGRHIYFERFRAELTMPHDAENRHRCTACGICQMNCPNGTITVTSRMEETAPADGKPPRKVLDRHLWDVGSCTFCDLCTRSCPQDAIEFTNSFEHSVFTRALLVKQLNRPGSRLVEKSAVAPDPQGDATVKTDTGLLRSARNDEGGDGKPQQITES